jgi:hypothetical protein
MTFVSGQNFELMSYLIRFGAKSKGYNARLLGQFDQWR